MSPERRKPPPPNHAVLALPISNASPISESSPRGKTEASHSQSLPSSSYTPTRSASSSALPEFVTPTPEPAKKKSGFARFFSSRSRSGSNRTQRSQKSGTEAEASSITSLDKMSFQRALTNPQVTTPNRLRKPRRQRPVPGDASGFDSGTMSETDADEVRFLRRTDSGVVDERHVALPMADQSDTDSIEVVGEAFQPNVSPTTIHAYARDSWSYLARSSLMFPSTASSTGTADDGSEQEQLSSSPPGRARITHPDAMRRRKSRPRSMSAPQRLAVIKEAFDNQHQHQRNVDESPRHHYHHQQASSLASSFLMFEAEEERERPRPPAAKSPSERERSLISALNLGNERRLHSARAARRRMGDESTGTKVQGWLAGVSSEESIDSAKHGRLDNNDDGDEVQIVDDKRAGGDVANVRNEAEPSGPVVQVRAPSYVARPESVDEDKPLNEGASTLLRADSDVKGPDPFMNASNSPAPDLPSPPVRQSLTPLSRTSLRSPSPGGAVAAGGAALGLRPPGTAPKLEGRLSPVQTPSPNRSTSPTLSNGSSPIMSPFANAVPVPQETAHNQTSWSKNGVAPEDSPREKRKVDRPVHHHVAQVPPIRPPTMPSRPAPLVSGEYSQSSPPRPARAMPYRPPPSAALPMPTSQRDYEGSQQIQLQGRGPDRIRDSSNKTGTVLSDYTTESESELASAEDQPYKAPTIVGIDSSPVRIHEGSLYESLNMTQDSQYVLGSLFFSEGSVG
jgi:hypothetical protein